MNKEKQEKESKIIYLRDVTESQIIVTDWIKEKFNIATRTGAVKYILDNFQDIFYQLEEAEKLNSKLERELNDSIYKQEVLQETWKKLNKLLKS